MHRVYANDNDPKIVEWLKCLPLQIDCIDGRSIKEIQAEDLSGFDQCHFFAGIAGWLLALQIAGWPNDVPVWTGSCPCQPFSAAGQRKGFDDDRHLWPELLRLISACQPTTIFGEQVASKAGREWLAIVFADLETLGYEVAGADLCAASVGAPHIRQRLYWVANATGRTSGRNARAISGKETQECSEGQFDGDMPYGFEYGGSDNGRLVDSNSRGFSSDQEQNGRPLEPEQQTPRWPNSMRSGVGLAHPKGNTTRVRHDLRSRQSYACESSRMGDPTSQRSLSSTLTGIHSSEESTRPRHGQFERPSWSDIEYIPCTDGKARPVKPAICPLAHGVSGRVAQLRGLGNAIVPQVAAEFISAFMEVKGIATVG